MVAPVRTTEYILRARTADGPGPSQIVKVEVIGDEGPPTGVREPARTAAEPPPQPQSVPAGELPAMASEKVIHDHEGLAGVASTGLGRIGIRREQRGRDYCEGTLSLHGNRVVFRGTHSFNQPFSAIAEVRTNRLPIQGKSAFHIKFKNGENYNFGAVSDDADSIAATLESFRRMSQ
jgi:hypothetical protein